MNATSTMELEKLLSEALQSVSVYQGQSTEFELEAYRKILKRCREVYDPERRRFVSLLKPRIGRSDTSERVLRFVCRELDPYLRDGTLHAATIAFLGGLGRGSRVEDVITNLIRLAVVDGASEAARAFANSISASSCTFCRFFLLTGVSVSRPFEVFEGVTLIPLPNSISELPPHVPDIPTESDRSEGVCLPDLPGKTMVRVEYDVQPIFHRPAEHYTLQSGPDRHFTISLRYKGAPAPDLNALCQALAVVGRCHVQSVLTWTSLLDYEVFDLSGFWGIGASGYGSQLPPQGFDDLVQLTDSHLQTIRTLYAGLTQLPTDTWQRLRVPIDRWVKAMAEDNPIDQIIDLGIALECLYVPDSQGEVSFRFALHGAWHLGRHKEERQALRAELKEIYLARSDVVHTGRLRGKRAKPSFDVSRLVARAQDVCWQGITSVIEGGTIPDWNDLVLGDDAH